MSVQPEIEVINGMDIRRTVNSSTHRVCDPIGEPHELDLSFGMFPVRIQGENEPQRRRLRFSLVVRQRNIPHWRRLAGVGSRSTLSHLCGRESGTDMRCKAEIGARLES